jgi:hypothetical protein
LQKLGAVRKHDIIQRMRLLGKLKLAALQTLQSQLSLMECIDGLHFDTLVQATVQLCCPEVDSRGRNLFKTPSIGLRLGHVLLKCAHIKRGMGIRRNDNDMRSEAERFIELHNGEWTDKVSSRALTTLQLKKDAKIEILPSTSDLVKLQSFQSSEIQKATDQLLVSPNYHRWRSLAEMTLSRIIVFNKRRGGEVSKLLLSSYVERPDWKKECNKDLIDTLKPIEKQLLNRMDLVFIPGKRNRKVPILLTTEVKFAMDAMVKTRSVCNIPSENPYFFSNDSSNGQLNGWFVLNKVAGLAGLEHAALITSTRLRKYIATVSQVINLLYILFSCDV